jgi:hypothetical protein
MCKEDFAYEDVAYKNPAYKSCVYTMHALEVYECLFFRVFDPDVIPLDR